MRVTAIIFTVIAAVIAGAAWALCAAGTSAEEIERAKEEEEDETFRA